LNAKPYRGAQVVRDCEQFDCPPPRSNEAFSHAVLVAGLRAREHRFDARTFESEFEILFGVVRRVAKQLAFS